MDDAPNGGGREQRDALPYLVLPRRLTTRPTEVAADDAALFLYPVQWRRGMTTHPTDAATDDAALFSY